MPKFNEVHIKVTNYVTTNDIRNDFLQIELNDHKFETYYVDSDGTPIKLAVSNRSATEHISSDDVTVADELYPTVTDFTTYIDNTKLDDSIFYYTGTTTSTDDPKIIIHRVGGVNTVVYTASIPTIHGNVVYTVTSDLGLIPGERYKVDVVCDTTLANPWTFNFTGETTGVINMVGKGYVTYTGAKKALVSSPSGQPASLSDITLDNNGVTYPPDDFKFTEVGANHQFGYNTFTDNNIGEIYAGNKFNLKFIGDPAFKV